MLVLGLIAFLALWPKRSSEPTPKVEVAVAAQPEPAPQPEATPETPAPGSARGEGLLGEKAVEAVADNNLYYDDEELDEFRGRDADSYTEAEVDRFREVLLTLRRDELLAWEAALRERQLALPAQLRDELILLLA